MSVLNKELALLFSLILHGKQCQLSITYIVNLFSPAALNSFLQCKVEESSHTSLLPFSAFRPLLSDFSIICHILHFYLRNSPYDVTVQSRMTFPLSGYIILLSVSIGYIDSTFPRWR